LVLVAGAIAFIELRLDAARPVSADTQRNSEPPAAEKPAKAEPTTVEQTSDTVTSKQRDAAPPSARETEDRSSREHAESGRPDRAIADAERLAKKEDEHRRAGEIVAPAGFVNADGFSVREAAGEKVVLLEFWTYTCFNCQNVQPYLNAWHDAYADDGLQVVGVHTPEFGFEREYANVEAAVREADIEYPVVLDNSYATWNAYDNRYWPAIYLIDADGFVRYQHFGEGAYSETQEKIEELLAERDRFPG
jgi:thiol-disulfide isomerase/thioredoxin